MKRKKKSVHHRPPIMVSRVTQVILLLLFLAVVLTLIDLVRVYRESRRPSPPPPLPDRVVEAMLDEELTVRNGPAELMVHKGARIIIPGSKDLHGRLIFLERGRVTVTLSESGTGRWYSVRAPNATVSAGEAVFSVELKGGIRTIVEVGRGRVVVENFSGETVVLSGGEAVTVEGFEESYFVPRRFDLPERPWRWKQSSATLAPSSSNYYGKGEGTRTGGVSLLEEKGDRGAMEPLYSAASEAPTAASARALKTENSTPRDVTPGNPTPVRLPRQGVKTVR
ncbi:MAG: hypothetical protein D6679_02445 [Candidatus Hydrogenedentota bacterium]|nr:MAG: hypothetical protein D6679_02445 [Candidatus Hydrogenedentota bacterium]